MTKNILITGAAGFLGPKLAVRLLSDPSYRVFLTDLNTPSVPPKAANPDNCTCIQADLCDSSSVAKLLSAAPEWHAIFIFHGIMSVGSEENPALAEKVNIDATRALLQSIADLESSKAGKKPRVIYASSQAVYGPPYTTSGPITDDTPITPAGVYGTHKYMMELYVNDMHRRGRLDAFSVRLPTVTVRPGAPSRSAAAYLSGMVREPMAGLECIVPTKDRTIRNVICSPRVMIENFVRLMDAPAKLMPENVRGVYAPGIVVTVQEMYDAFVKVCGKEKESLLKEETDEEAERLLKGWPQNAEFGNAQRLGLLFDETCEQIFQEYVDSLKA
ncbi:NAD dependent epimerase/dehydratase family protein [Sarocladium implicatum]|nr:NAD dependent epimerase/dehydratase family protein [Sarocladium implicatum]